MTQKNQTQKAIATEAVAPVETVTTTNTMDSLTDLGLDTLEQEENLSDPEPSFDLEEPNFIELSLDEIDNLSTQNVKSKTENVKSNKKASEAWIRAKAVWVDITSDVAKPIRDRYARIHKAFKTHNIDRLKINFGELGVLELNCDGSNFRSIERVLREFTFKNTIDGKDYHTQFEDAMKIHEPNVYHNGRTARNEVVRPEYFIIHKAV